MPTSLRQMITSSLSVTKLLFPSSSSNISRIGWSLWQTRPRFIMLHRQNFLLSRESMPPSKSHAQSTPSPRISSPTPLPTTPHWHESSDSIQHGHHRPASGNTRAIAPHLAKQLRAHAHAAFSTIRQRHCARYDRCEHTIDA